MSLFGTDGIRGRVGEFPIDPQSFLQLGWALGLFAQKKRVLIAKDTRLSGYMLESSLCAGLTTAGCDVFLTGPLPTPALAYLTQSLGAELGIMISASHNPYYDNGVKIFSQGAHKLSDCQQQAIEALISEPVIEMDSLGKIYRLADAPKRYLDFLKRHVTFLNLHNKTVTIDCAHGAAYKIAPQIFEEYQAIVHVLHAEPNGFNINEQCGALDCRALEHHMLHHKSDYGIAFDGDADRVVLYIKGKRCDPHYMLLMLYEMYKRRTGLLGGIIGTQIHNQGLVSYCQKEKIPWIEVPVGDRYLIAAARETGFKVAGEPSGHYILMDQLPTADGLLTALLLIEEIELGYVKDLTWYETYVTLDPSFSYTFSVSDPKFFIETPLIQQTIHALKNAHPSWKILVRPSGTEPVIRLYIEGQLSQEASLRLYNQLKSVINRELACESAMEGVYFGKNTDSQLEASLG
jgi:phosphoglucosamine mutase